MTQLPTLALSLTLLLAACGQSGALYLPEKEKAPVPQAPPPAVAHPPADAAQNPVPEAPPAAVAKPKNDSSPDSP
ncbi:LPS translocon maturation chaperone LptM [Solimonas fluminis]|uniref:LPS translocon maturation chaperone LptM n=1 Tax=Solimonas fluminis TaxID=2086571 RepID=UPI001A9C5F2D|nr:lipoprotein [Solimonas fluminis]